MWSAVRTDISQAHNVDLSQSLHETREFGLPDTADREKKYSDTRRCNDRQWIKVHGIGVDIDVDTVAFVLSGSTRDIALSVESP